MKLGLLPLVKYALLSAALAGCASFGDGSLNATEKVMFSTYPLFTDKIVGTCFFVAMKDPRNRNCYFPVVVTSKHMLKAAGKDRLFIPLRAIGADGKISFFLVRVGAVPGREPFYVGHPNFDVAAFPLLIPESLEPQFALRLLEGKNLVAEVRAGENVSFLGFPEGLPGTPDLFPVLRSGRIASYDPAGFASRHFLLNGDVYPGDSGSPILLASRKGRPSVVGMIVQRVEIEENERSPIALAVDAGIIQETLDLLASRLAP